jgi:hypothetical protein
MKKDKYGTIIGTSRKSPYGYGLCAACNHPNVFLNARGQIDEHGSIELGDRCPGSLSAPANVGGKNVYLLITQMTLDRSRPIWQERFCFLAPSAKQAESDVRAWFRYQGMHYDPENVLIRTVPPGQVSSENLHDDWIPR